MALSPKKPTSLALDEGSNKGLKKKKSFQFKAFDKVRKLMKRPNKEAIEGNSSPLSLSPATTPSSLPAQQHRHIVGSTQDVFTIPTIVTPTQDNHPPGNRKMSLSADNVCTSVDHKHSRDGKESSRTNSKKNSNNKGSNVNKTTSNNKPAKSKDHKDRLKTNSRNHIENCPDYDDDDDDDDNNVKNDDNDDGLPQSPHSFDSKNKKKPRNSPSFDSGHCRLSEDSSEDNLDEDSQRPRATPGTSTKEAPGQDLQSLDVEGFQKLDLSVARHRKNIRPTGRRAVTVFRTSPTPMSLSQVEEEGSSFMALHKSLKVTSSRDFHDNAETNNKVHTDNKQESKKDEEKNGKQDEKRKEEEKEEKDEKEDEVRNKKALAGTKKSDELELRQKPTKADLLRNKNAFVVNLEEIQAKRRTIALVQPSSFEKESSPSKEVDRSELSEMFNRLQGKSFRSKEPVPAPEKDKPAAAAAAGAAAAGAVAAVAALAGAASAGAGAAAGAASAAGAAAVAGAAKTDTPLKIVVKKEVPAEASQSVEKDAMVAKKGNVVQNKSFFEKKNDKDAEEVKVDKKESDENKIKNSPDNKPLFPKPLSTRSFKVPAASQEPPVIAAKPERFVKKSEPPRESTEKAVDSEVASKDPLWKVKALEKHKSPSEAGSQESLVDKAVSENRSKLASKLMAFENNKDADDTRKSDRTESAKETKVVGRAGLWSTEAPPTDKTPKKSDILPLKPKVSLEKPVLKAVKVDKEEEEKEEESGVRGRLDSFEKARNKFGAPKLNKVSSDIKENTSPSNFENSEKGKILRKFEKERHVSESDGKDAEDNNPFKNVKLNSVAFSSPKPFKMSTTASSSSSSSSPNSKVFLHQSVSNNDAPKKEASLKPWQQSEGNSQATKPAGAPKFSSVKESTSSKTADSKAPVSKAKVLPPGIKSIPPPSFQFKHSSNN